VVAGATEECGRAAAELLAPIAPDLHRVSSLEAAELTKLYENTFRAVNIALANELAGIGRTLGLDPVEVTEAAATKPYGFMPFFPSAGVGGHCIPCDPHYLLASVDGETEAPLVAQAMGAIAQRPARVAERAVELLEADGIDAAGARVLVVGATYKPGVRDVRESPGVEILRELHTRGADVHMHDPLVDAVAVDGPGSERPTVDRPDPAAYDLVVLATVQPGADLRWLGDAERVLDATYRVRDGRRRFLV
jgi:nucleotide sugar dehydrogenase